MTRKINLKNYASKDGTRLRVWNTRNGARVIVTRHFVIDDLSTGKTRTVYVGLGINEFLIGRWNPDGTSYQSSVYDYRDIVSTTRDTVKASVWEGCPNKIFDPIPAKEV
jgi:hypothetical protein